MASFSITIISAVGGEELATLTLDEGQTVGELRLAVAGSCISGDPLASVQLIFNGEALLEEALTLQRVGLHDGAEVQMLKHPAHALVAVSSNGVARWDGSSAEPHAVLSFAKPLKKTTFGGISADGQWVWAAAGKLQSTATGVEKALAERHVSLPSAASPQCAMSPLASHVAFVSGCDDDGLNLFDLQTGHTVSQRICCGNSGMDFLRFSLDGQAILVAYGFCEELVRIASYRWEGGSFQLQSCHNFKESRICEDWSNFLLLSSDGREIIASVPAPSCLRSDAETEGMESGSESLNETSSAADPVLKVLAGIEFVGATAPACLCPRGVSLMAGSRSKSCICIFSVSDGRELFPLVGSSCDESIMAFSQDARLAALGSWKGTVSVWDAKSGAHLATCTCTEQLYGLSFASPDVAPTSAESGRGLSCAPPEIAAAEHFETESQLVAQGPTDGPAKKTAVVARTRSPTVAMLNRFVDWSVSLASLKNVDFFISIDTTHDKEHQHSHRIANAFRARGVSDVVRAVGLHEYTEGDLEHEYPVLAEGLGAAIPSGAGHIQSSKRAVAKSFRCQTLALWRKSLPDGGLYLHTWVFEDDFGYSGSIADLIMAYSQDAADLISGPSLKSVQESAEIVKHEGWNSEHICTAQFDHRATAKFVTDEFVQRLSLELLDELDRWMQDGAIAWSNQMCPSVCLTTGMLWQALRQEDIGDAWSWNDRVSEDDWNAICEGVTRGLDHGRCFHALKF